MFCNSCKKEFENINGLIFCPYCGEKIIDYSTTEKIKYDTLEMPIITEDIIKKHNRTKFFTDLRSKLTQKRVVVTSVTIFCIIVVMLLGYKLFIIKPVDQAIINQDLIGSVIVLPKGTKINVKKSYIKNLIIQSRNTDKTKGEDDIKVAITLNNGVIEVKTLLSMIYINEGKNRWQFNGKVNLAGKASIIPLVGMDAAQLTNGLKNSTVVISDETIDLSDSNVKSINIKQRTPNLENRKEDILVTIGIDNGLLLATGDIKCKLNFINEKWNIGTIERNSTKDFVLALSPSFTNDKIIDIIKKEGLEEAVTYKDLFGGKDFDVKDSFTKSITSSNKKFDPQNKTLKETVKREIVAGEINSQLLTDYTFALTFSNITFQSKSSSTVLSATVNEISDDLIKSTITNAEIEGSNKFFWFFGNHKITAKEAKTFKTSEILSKKGLINIKYVYGNITYTDKEKQKTVSVVALYSLGYDTLKGYNWKLNKVVSEDSPSYNSYSKEAITK